MWLRLALVGVIVLAVAAAVHKFTSFLGEKDRMIEQRDQEILNLNARVAGMKLDVDRLQQSNASLETEVRRKIEEAAQARAESNSLRLTDAVSAKRQGDLERRLNDRERIEQVDRVAHSRRAELVVRVVNRSAKCEIEHFFADDGQCRNGEWVRPPAPKEAPAARASAPADGASGASR